MLKEVLVREVVLYPGKINRHDIYKMPVANIIEFPEHP